MSVYVDTSAFLAVLDADDEYHPQAKRVWEELLRAGVPLICSSYVLVETYALVQHRLGLEALKVFHEDIFPLLRVERVEETLHENAANAVLTAKQQRLSLVDCVSFALMRRLGLKEAFAFDQDFGAQGFTCLP
ncbi:MAG TPA: PIN domain-containing protein [Desulfotomaculum sp.]|nr:PIN domain-containing protein [Desulfotomaculum sp.]